MRTGCPPEQDDQSDEDDEDEADGELEAGCDPDQDQDNAFGRYSQVWQPARATSPGQEVPLRSGRFWYSDGTVVIRVHDILYKLYRMQLAEKCTYFAALFASGGRRGGQRYTAAESLSGRRIDLTCEREEEDVTVELKVVDGCVVYTVFEDVCTAQNFEMLLECLNTPLYVLHFDACLIVLRTD